MEVEDLSADVTALLDEVRYLCNNITIHIRATRVLCRKLVCFFSSVISFVMCVRVCVGFWLRVFYIFLSSVSLFLRMFFFVLLLFCSLYTVSVVSCCPSGRSPPPRTLLVLVSRSDLIYPSLQGRLV